MRRVYTATTVAVCEVTLLSRFAYTHTLSVLAADNVFALSCVLGIVCAVVEAAGVQLAAPRAQEAWARLLHLRVALAAYAFTPWILGLYVGAAWVYLWASAGFRNAGACAQSLSAPVQVCGQRGQCLSFCTARGACCSWWSLCEVCVTTTQTHGCAVGLRALRCSGAWRSCMRRTVRRPGNMART